MGLGGPRRSSGEEVMKHTQSLSSARGSESFSLLCPLARFVTSGAGPSVTGPEACTI